MVERAGVSIVLAISFGPAWHGHDPAEHAHFMEPLRMQLPERVELGRTPAKLGWQSRGPDAMLAVHREPLESSEGGVAAHAYSSPPARTLHSLPCIHRRLFPEAAPIRQTTRRRD